MLGYIHTYIYVDLYRYRMVARDTDLSITIKEKGNIKCDILAKHGALKNFTQSGRTD